MTEDGIGYAMMILNGLFSTGAKSCDTVRAFCREREITKGELRAARKELQVKTFRKNGIWYWDVDDENRANYGSEWPEVQQL